MSDDANPFKENGIQTLFFGLNSLISLALFCLFVAIGVQNLNSEPNYDLQNKLYEAGIFIISCVSLGYSIFFMLYGMLLVRSLTKDFASPYARKLFLVAITCSICFLLESTLLLYSVIDDTNYNNHLITLNSIYFSLDLLVFCIILALFLRSVSEATKASSMAKRGSLVRSTTYTKTTATTGTRTALRRQGSMVMSQYGESALIAEADTEGNPQRHKRNGHHKGEGEDLNQKGPLAGGGAATGAAYIVPDDDSHDRSKGYESSSVLSDSSGDELDSRAHEREDSEERMGMYVGTGHGKKLLPRLMKDVPPEISQSLKREKSESQPEHTSTEKGGKEGKHERSKSELANADARKERDTAILSSPAPSALSQHNPAPSPASTTQGPASSPSNQTGTNPLSSPSQMPLHSTHQKDLPAPRRLPSIQVDSILPVTMPLQVASPIPLPHFAAKSKAALSESSTVSSALSSASPSLADIGSPIELENPGSIAFPDARTHRAKFPSASPSELEQPHNRPLEWDLQVRIAAAIVLAAEHDPVIAVPTSARSDGQVSSRLPVKPSEWDLQIPLAVGAPVDSLSSANSARGRKSKPSSLLRRRLLSMKLGEEWRIQCLSTLLCQRWDWIFSAHSPQVSRIPNQVLLITRDLLEYHRWVRNC